MRLVRMEIGIWLDSKCHHSIPIEWWNTLLTQSNHIILSINYQVLLRLCSYIRFQEYLLDRIKNSELVKDQILSPLNQMEHQIWVNIDNPIWLRVVSQVKCPVTIQIQHRVVDFLIHR